MLGQADHPFIVQLVCTYADPTHIYFLMTPALGGEILNVVSVLGDDEGAMEEKAPRASTPPYDLTLLYKLTDTSLTHLTLASPYLSYLTVLTCL